MQTSTNEFVKDKNLDVDDCVNLSNTSPWRRKQTKIPQIALRFQSKSPVRNFDNNDRNEKRSLNKQYNDDVHQNNEIKFNSSGNLISSKVKKDYESENEKINGNILVPPLILNLSDSETKNENCQHLIGNKNSDWNKLIQSQNNNNSR